MLTGSKVIGRDGDLTALYEATVEASRPAIVLGEPGIGKTALVHKLEELAERRGISVSKATCFNIQPPISFLPVLSVLSDVARQFNVHVPEFVEQVESLAGRGLQKSAPDYRLRFFYEVSRSLQGLAEVGQHVFIVEDLHSADLDTLHLLNYLTSKHQDGIGFCFTARKGVALDRERSEALELLVQACTPINLTGLSRYESGLLLTALCGPLQDREVSYLHQLTRGNPLFLNELGRYLREADPGSQSSVQDIIERLGLPQTLDQMLDQCVALLAPEDRDILQVASCMGAQFSRWSLSRLADVLSGTIEDALARAERAGLVRAIDDVDLDRMEFLNPLVRERVYRSMPPSIRRKVHGLLIEMDRELGMLTTEERAIHSARAYSGSRNAEAIDACTQAALHSERMLAYQSASDFWRLALTCTDPGTNRERAELLLRQGSAAKAVGNWSRALSALQRAYEQYVALEEHGTAAEIACLIGEIHRFTLDLPAAVTWLRVSVESSLLSDATRARALALLGSAYVSLDNLALGAEYLTAALECARLGGEIPADVARWAYFGLTLAGHADEAREMALIGLASAQRGQQSSDIAQLAMSLTFWSLHKLQPDEAKAYVEMGDTLPQPIDTVGVISLMSARTIFDAYCGRWESVYRTSLTWLKEVRLAGEFQRATALLMVAESASILDRHEEALSAMDSALRHLGSMNPLGSLYKARILLRNGCAGGAQELLNQWGEQVLGTEKSPGGRAVLGDLVGSLGDDRLASRLYERLKTETRPLLIVYTPTSVQRVLGKLAALLGHREAAYEHFEQAIAALRAGRASWELATTYLDYALYRGRSNQRREQKKSKALRDEGLRLFAALGMEPPVVWLDGSSTISVEPAEELSPREKEILARVRDGRTNRDIALELSLSVHTVDRHIEHILAKLGAANRTEAVARFTAMAQGTGSGID